MNKRRLLKLAEFLEKVPRKRFDYASWVGDDWGGKQDLSCGTTACAMGWACTIPSFRKAGLKLKNSLLDGTSLRTAYYTSNVPYFNGFEGFDAAALFFDIDLRDARYLFGEPNHTPFKDTSEVTPKQVAKLIRKFVEGKREYL